MNKPSLVSSLVQNSAVSKFLRSFHFNLNTIIDLLIFRFRQQLNLFQYLGNEDGEQTEETPAEPESPEPAEPENPAPEENPAAPEQPEETPAEPESPEPAPAEPESPEPAPAEPENPAPEEPAA